ncbi:hypothetical protein AGMMS50230_06750 [Spirochaetia bacterium]|nr:hypothetical protein AGMMS50230_06750 [Spirochaetia bacterium]
MLRDQFFNQINDYITTIKATQGHNIRKAAETAAEKLEKGGIMYAFGTGHSHILAEELYARAGGLVQVKAVMPHELTVDLDMDKSTLMERTDGLAEVVFATHKMRKDDVLVLVSNSGRNPVPVQMALGAKARGIAAIAVTNLTHSKSIASRDKSGKKLYELCDVVLDTCGPVGDACVQPAGKTWSIAPVSNILGGIIAEALVCDIVEIMLSHGVEPPVYQSANLDGNDEYNRQLRENLKERFPELRDIFSTF